MSTGICAARISSDIRRWIWPTCSGVSFRLGTVLLWHAAPERASANYGLGGGMLGRIEHGILTTWSGLVFFSALIFEC